MIFGRIVKFLMNSYAKIIDKLKIRRYTVVDLQKL